METKKHFTTSQEELYFNQRNEAIELLKEIVDWSDNHDIWWVDCPNKGGLDIDKLEKFLKTIE